MQQYNNGVMQPITKQRLGDHVPAEMRRTQYSYNGNGGGVFSVGSAPRLYSEGSRPTEGAQMKFSL
jgi:hypothetical protein